MEYKINNAEFVLLLVMTETEWVNGYQLRQIITDRGMEAWAGVSTSSIYVMLKKLEARGFVTSKADTEKRTKGARGQVYSTSINGLAALKMAMEAGLSKSREHDPRFNIALSGLDMLGHVKVGECLRNRLLFLTSELERLTDVEGTQVGLPLSAKLLFDHIKFGIKQETIWLESAISKIEEGNKQNERDS